MNNKIPPHSITNQNLPFGGWGGSGFRGLYLIGFMGSGKSYLGRIWATKYNLTFYDLDALIEQTENQTIAQIFDTKGEQYFREIETEILHKTAAYKNAIIACGGGTACFNNNMEWMNKNGNTVFLNQTKEAILKNIIADKNIRPLVANQTPEILEQFIAEKLAERLPFYEQCKYVLQPNQLIENGLEELFVVSQ